MPVALKASTITSVIMPTACLNTSRPSMRRWPTVWVEDGPPSTYSFALCRPSERRCVVRMPRSLASPGLRLRFEHHGAGAVAEQHAGAAIGPVENAREGLRADHQRALVGAGAQEIVGGRQRKDEARAHRLQVEGRAVV